MRASTLLLAGLVAGAGLFTYQVKHRVSLLDQELARAGRELVAEQERLHVFDAEWSLLNEPERLRRLAEQHLQLAPMQPRQFAELADAMRRVLDSPEKAQAMGREGRRMIETQFNIDRYFNEMLASIFFAYRDGRGSGH